MITLTFDSKDAGKVLFNRNGKKQNLATSLMAEVLKELKLNTTLTIKTSNTKVSKHSGEYFLLFLQEFEEVSLLYLDSQGVLKQIYVGPEADVMKALYFNIADDTQVKILKSSHKQAYRVVEKAIDGTEKVITIDYKNKSSQIVSKTYLELFEALKFAALRYKKQDCKVTYKVITPKGTVLFQVGQ